MATGRTSLLNLPLPTEGELDGSWGDMVNNGLTEYIDIAVAGMDSLTSANFTAGALTLANTTGTDLATNIAATSAQYATIKVSSLATNSTITAPSSNRSYRIINADATYTLTIKASGQTGVTFSAGQTGVVAFNGTDYVLIGISFATPLTVVGNATAGSEIRLPEDTDNGSNYVALKAPDTLASNLTFTLPSADGSSGQTITTNGSGTLSFGTLGVAGGGTGLSTTTAYGLVAAGTTSTGNFQQVSGTGTSGQLLTSNGAGALPTWQNAPASGVSKGQSIAFALIFGL